MFGGLSNKLFGELTWCLKRHTQKGSLVKLEFSMTLFQTKHLFWVQLSDFPLNLFCLFFTLAPLLFSDDV